MFIKKDVLNGLLAPFQGFLAKTASPMVLANIKLSLANSKLIAIGANKHLFVRNTLDFESKESFDILVNFDLLQKTLKHHGSVVELIFSTKSLKIVSGKKESEIILSMEEFVVFPNVDGDGRTIDNKELLDILKQVTLSSSNAAPFDIVCWRDNKIVASNRFRLTVGDFLANDFVLPLQTAQYLLKYTNKIDRLTLLVADKWVVFKNDELEIVSVKIDFQFPDYNFLLETSPHLMIMGDTAELKAGFENIALFNETAGFLETTPTGIKLTATGQRGVGEVEIPCDAEGKSTRIGLNPTALLRYIRARRADRTYLEIRQGEKFKIIGLAGKKYNHYIPELLS